MWRSVPWIHPILLDVCRIEGDLKQPVSVGIVQGRGSPLIVLLVDVTGCLQMSHKAVRSEWLAFYDGMETAAATEIEAEEHRGRM